MATTTDRKRPDRPRDRDGLAAPIVDIAAFAIPLPVDSRPSVASKLGVHRGLKGGYARADKLRQERRKQIARAVTTRWRRDDDGSSSSEQVRRGSGCG